MKKYPSKYSNDKLVSSSQYITEFICEKKAKKDNIDLGFKFWTNTEWSSFYRSQIASANKLLKKYSDTAIVNALSNPKTEKTYSLRAPFLIPIIEEEERKLAASNKTLTKNFERKSEIDFNSKEFKKKPSIISKLKEIDNDN